STLATELVDAFKALVYASGGGLRVVISGGVSNPFDCNLQIGHVFTRRSDHGNRQGPNFFRQLLTHLLKRSVSLSRDQDSLALSEQVGGQRCCGVSLACSGGTLHRNLRMRVDPFYDSQLVVVHGQREEGI